METSKTMPYNLILPSQLHMNSPPPSKPCPLNQSCIAADQSGKEIRFLFQYYKQRPESNLSLDLGYPIAHCHLFVSNTILLKCRPATEKWFNYPGSFRIMIYPRLVHFCSLGATIEFHNLHICKNWLLLAFGKPPQR